MEYTFSTQMLGTLCFILSCTYLICKWYYTKKIVWGKVLGVLLTAGFIVTYVWNPVKLESPSISDIEYQEKEVVVIPTKVLVKVSTLEDKQAELQNKLEER